MNKIIIDTDPGIDDAHAIALAVKHTKIELLGLTTVFGNAAIDITTFNALALLELFDRADIPVAQGAAIPLEQAPMPPADFVHGANGLGNVSLPPPGRSVEEETAAEFIIRQANEHPGELTLVAIGPLTNIAQALSLDPGLPDKLKQLVVMGGAVKEPGNVTPLAESNFINDPHAADQVLSQNWPVALIGLDVTHRLVLYEKNFDELREKAGKIGDFIWRSTQFYLDYYASRYSRPGTGGQVENDRRCAMHDASAIAYVIEPEAFTMESGPARVVQNGIAVGQLAIDVKGLTNSKLFPYWQNRPNSFAAVAVDRERVKSLFIDTLIGGASS